MYTLVRTNLYNEKGTYMNTTMKDFMKKAAKSVIGRSELLRETIRKLNNAVLENDDGVPVVKKRRKNQLYTGKAAFTGSSVDNLNSIILPKEERANELKQIFYKHCHYYLNLENPRTFNQKLQWLKLNWYHEDMVRAVDKAEFKRYIAEKIGEGYTVPLYGEWERESEINFDELPDRFVLKSNVQSDGRHIIKIHDKSVIDRDRLLTLLSSWLLRRNNLCSSYCAAYSRVKPKIIAEQFIEGFDKSLTDYKFLCFNGRAKLLFTVSDRWEKMSMNFYDLDWNLLPFTRVYPNTSRPVKKPVNFGKMVEIAEKLAKPFPFVRVDFYESAEGRLYVGELTFYPGGGYEAFTPMEWDYKLGDMLQLPEANI